MDSETERAVIAKLVALGGNEWTKGDYHRVYFDTDTISKLGGFEYYTYKTGNIQGAALNGESISNSKASRIRAGLVTIYYDLKTHGWFYRTAPSAEARPIAEAFLAIARPLTRELAEA